MREILFRGKCFINDKWEWVYGYYAPVYLFSKDGKEDNTYCIISDKYIGRTEMLGCGVQSGLPANYMIKKETLGQYTGLKDKNGTKIFEGDIFGDSKGQEIDVVVFEDGCFKLKSYGFIEYCLDGNAYEERWSELECEPICNFCLEHDEILGNIHDNPELLGVDNG